MIFCYGVIFLNSQIFIVKNLIATEVKREPGVTKSRETSMAICAHQSQSAFVFIGLCVLHR